MDVMVRRVVEHERVDMLGPVALQGPGQPGHDSGNRTRLFIGELGETADMPLALDEQVTQVSVDCLRRCMGASTVGPS
jgi:hypothetical protein